MYLAMEQVEITVILGFADGRNANIVLDANSSLSDRTLGIMIEMKVL